MLLGVLKDNCLNISKFETSGFVHLYELPMNTREVCLTQQNIFYISEAGALVKKDFADFSETVIEPALRFQKLCNNASYLLALTTDNILVVFDYDFNIIRRIPTGFDVYDMTIGLEDTIWLTGRKQIHGGYEVFWINEEGKAVKIPEPAAALKVSGFSDGLAWTINGRNEVWKLHRLGEGNTPGCKMDAACRGCLSKSYGQVKDIRITQNGMLVINSINKEVKVYDFPGSNFLLHQVKDIDEVLVF
ncbi:MAG TPA: hypothetical protein VD993_20395 [Chitinophagaceae bacterium]|nr:hypothetical protein [Chitinophagaceae bacterium]